jgi:hypothetical protein
MVRGNPVPSRSDKPSLVQLQTVNGRPADGCLAANSQAAVNPLKMLTPTMSARIEKRHNLSGFGIGGRSGACLAEIATGTAKTEIVRIIAAVRVDVLDVHWLSGVVFARLTVLAAAISAFIDEPFGCPPG